LPLLAQAEMRWRIETARTQRAVSARAQAHHREMRHGFRRVPASNSRHNRKSRLDVVQFPEFLIAFSAQLQRRDHTALASQLQHEGHVRRVRNKPDRRSHLLLPGQRTQLTSSNLFGRKPCCHFHSKLLLHPPPLSVSVASYDDVFQFAATATKQRAIAPSPSPCPRLTGLERNLSQAQSRELRHRWATLFGGFHL
jgi:hypothetical protein